MTVSPAKRVASWKLRDRPRAARMSGGRSTTSAPNRETEPSPGRMTPEMTFISVVLPAPLAPMRPTISPGPTVMSGSSRATMPPNRTRTPVTSSGCAELASGSPTRMRVARRSR